MEKRKVKATTNYRGKASDYHLDCSYHLRIQKAKGSRKQQHRTTGYNHQHSR